MAANTVSPANATTGQSATPAPPNAASTTGDASAGRLVFRKCQACRSTEPGKNMLGPSLAGVVGRKAGTEAGFNYSPAMKSADIVWNPQTLDQYLTDPAKVKVDPGQEKSMTWKALVPGLYVYHCATPMVAEHLQTACTA